MDDTTGQVQADGRQRLWRTSVGDDLAFLLARANAVSLASANRILADEGLKVRSYSVLALVAAEARPTQRELSDFLRLDPSQIVALVDDLQDRGWVIREPDPTDRRAKVVVVTAAGRDAYARAHRRVEAHEREHFAILDDDEIAQLTSFMQRLARIDE